MEVIVSPEAEGVAVAAGLSIADIRSTAISTSGALIYGPPVDRVLSAKRVNGQRVFVSCQVSKFHILPNGNKKIDQLCATVALLLRDDLPVGEIEDDTDADEILEVVARSFGLPLTCDIKAARDFLYSGPWDGNPPRVLTTGLELVPLIIEGSFDAATHSCRNVWAFSADKYLRWRASGPKG